MALEQWVLGRQVAVVGAADAAGCRRLLAAGARHVLVVGEGVAAGPGIDVHPASEILPLRSASVDVVLALAVDMDPSARGILIGEAARVLRPGGLLTLQSRPGDALRAEIRGALSGRFTAIHELAVRRLRGLAIAPIAAGARRTFLYDEPAQPSPAADLEAVIVVATLGERDLAVDGCWIAAPSLASTRAIDPRDEQARRLAAEAELAAVQRRIDALQAELVARGVAAREAEDLRTSALARREAALDEREGALAGRARSLDERESRSAATAEDLGAREAAVSARDEAISAEKAALDERSSALAAREAEANAEATNLAALRSELHARDEALTARESEVEARREGLATREAEVAAEQASLTAARAELAARVREVEARAAEVAAEKESLATARAEVDARVQEIEARAAEVAREKESLAAARAEVAAEKESLAAARAEVVTEKESLAAARAEVAAEKESLVAARSEAETRAHSLEARETEVTAEKDSLAAARAEVVTEKESLAAARAEVAAEKESLAAARSEAETRAHSLAARETELRTATGALKEARSEVEARSTDITWRETELAVEAEALEDARAEVEGRSKDLTAREAAIAAPREVSGAGDEAQSAAATAREEALAAAEEALAARLREASAREAELVARAQALTDRERALSTQTNEALTEREALAARASELAALEAALAGREAALKGRDAELGGREAALSAREAAWTDREAASATHGASAGADAPRDESLEIIPYAPSPEPTELDERRRRLDAREVEVEDRARALERREGDLRRREGRGDAAGEPASRVRPPGELSFDELEIELIDIAPPTTATKEGRGEGSELARAQALAEERLRQIEALQRALDDAEERLAALHGGDAGRGGADIALDRDRLREELVRRTSDLQLAEEKAWQATESAQKERIENVRLVAEVDRLREQVDRSRGAEQERLREVEALGHELRRLELAHAELQGLLASKTQRLDELESRTGADGPPDQVELREALRARSAELERVRARDHANLELVRRREREADEAQETIAQLRRTIDDYAAAAANLRGELVVIQVEVEQLQSMTPGMQQQIADYRRKLKEREDESSGLQRQLEEATAQQQHLRARLRERKRELEEALSRRDALQVELEGVRAELVACRQALSQLEHTVSRTGAQADGEVVGHALRAELAAQASRFAEELSRVEARSESLVLTVRDRLQRAELEAKIRADEQEYLLVQLDTSEQRIWEMTDASDRSAARLAAGLAQYEKQREQLEDLVHELEVTRNLLAEAESRVVDLERTLASDRVRLVRMGVESPTPESSSTHEAAESGVWAPVTAFPRAEEPAPMIDDDDDGVVAGEVAASSVEARVTLDDELLRLTDAILDAEPELAGPIGVTPRTSDEYDRELEEILAGDDVMPSVLPSLGLGADVDSELIADVEEAMAESRASVAEVIEPSYSGGGGGLSSETGIIIEILGDESWPEEAWPAVDAPADVAPPLTEVAGEVDVSVIIDEVDETDASYIDIDVDEWSEAQKGRRARMDTIRATVLPVMALGDDESAVEIEGGEAKGPSVAAPVEVDVDDMADVVGVVEVDDPDVVGVVDVEDDGIVIVDDEDDEDDIVGVEGWLGAVLPGDDADILADLVGVPEDDDEK